MPPLSVCLLGSARASHAGREVRFPTRKALALLAFLSAEPGLHSRERLIALLWPDSDQERGRTSLRSTLTMLRRALAEPSEGDHFETSRGGVGLRADSDLRLDLRILRDAAELARSSPDAVALRLISTLENAADLWRGEFLAGLDLADAALEFDEWLTLQRALWRDRVATVFERLSALKAATGDTAEALEVARRWVALDPYSDPARRRVIELRLAGGDRPGALAEYVEFERIVREELGTDPEPETRALTERARGPAAVPRRIWPLPLAGREAEHAMLVGAFRSARAAAAAAFVIGESGMGKSRLADEFLLWATAHGADVLRGRGFEIGGRLPHQPVTEAIRGRLAEATQPDSLLPDQPWRRHLARLLPEIGEPDASTTLEDRVHLYEAVARFLAGLAASGPLVLAIDDLQWIDDGSLEVVQYAARRLRGLSRPVLLLGCIRSEDLAEDLRLTRWLAALEREIPITRVRLEALQAPAISALLVAAGLSPDLAERLQVETGGQPLLIIETLRHWRDQGVPPTGPGLAPGALAAIKSRLRGLNAEALEAAGAASVLGTRFEPTLVARILGRDEMDVLRALEHLVRRSLASPVAHMYEFSHDRVRQAVYDDLSEPRRRLLHTRALQALREVGAAAAQTAEQAASAGFDDLAAELSVSAGDAALRVFAGADAVRHYRRALLRPPVGQDLADLHRRLGDALRIADALTEAAGEYREMLAEAYAARQPDARVAALNRLALTLSQGAAGREDPEALLAEALLLAGDAPVQVETRANLSLVLMYAGRMSDALVEARAAHAASLAGGLVEVGALAATANAQAALFTGFWDESASLAEEAASTYRRLGNLVLEANALSLASGARVRLGHSRVAIDRATRALAIVENLANAWGMATAVFHLAEARLDLGEPGTALLLAERGLKAAVESAFAPLVACQHLIAGRAFLSLGDAARAESSFAAGLEAAAGQPLAVFNEVWLSGLGAAKLLGGDVVAAAAYARRALALRSESSAFCILLRPWDAAALTLDGAPDEARRDLDALEAHVGQFESARRVVELGREAAASASLEAALRILLRGC
jgi:DNA-binding SARP family transcriptional activator